MGEGRRSDVETGAAEPHPVLVVMGRQQAAACKPRPGWKQPAAAAKELRARPHLRHAQRSLLLQQLQAAGQGLIEGLIRVAPSLHHL